MLILYDQWKDRKPLPFEYDHGFGDDNYFFVLGGSPTFNGP